MSRKFGKYKLKDGFYDTYLKLERKCGKERPDIYKAVKINRQTLSNALGTLIPHKDTIIALAIGMELNIEDTEELLNSAGYTLSDSILFDTIVKKYIVDKKYNIEEINEELNNCGCKLLGSKKNR